MEDQKKEKSSKKVQAKTPKIVKELWATESERVCKLIEPDKQPNVAITVALNTHYEMETCGHKISQKCSYTVVVLLANTAVENSLLVTVIIPTSKCDILELNFLDACVFGLTKSAVKNIRTNIGWSGAKIQTVSLSYPELSEWVPEKLVDRVRSNAFMFLKVKELYVEPPDDDEEMKFLFDGDM